MRIQFIVLTLCTTLIFAGCAGGGLATERGSQATPRNQQLAAELTQKASSLIESDPNAAMRLLRLAVDADLYHGPAHNNIGVILLSRGDLYGSAEEFDLARRLMPGHPDPRINLGIALERGGKIEDALDAYASAIEVYPNHLPAMQALARLQIRSGRADEWTDELLKEIWSRGDEPWSRWARNQILQD